VPAGLAPADRPRPADHADLGSVLDQRHRARPRGGRPWSAPPGRGDRGPRLGPDRPAVTTRSGRGLSHGRSRTRFPRGRA
jgi:hypothetical protein